MVSFFQSIGNASDGISSKDPTLTCEMGKCRAKSCANGCHLRASSQCPCRLFHSCLFPFIFPFRRPEALDRHRSPHRNTFLGQRQFFCSFPSRRRSRSPPCHSRSRPLTCSCSFPCRTCSCSFPCRPCLAGEKYNRFGIHHAGHFGLGWRWLRARLLVVGVN